MEPVVSDCCLFKASVIGLEFSEWLTETSGLSKLVFGVSRFGGNHGCGVLTAAIAKTAQGSNPIF